MFAGRDLCIATMHHKEKVIAPALEKELGVRCFNSSDLNTDLLGTFSGEIERLLSPAEAAKQKCILAMDTTGCDLAVSSEGSFGPHPVIGFVPCNEEILYLYDKRHNIEIIVREQSTKTNFSGEDLWNFAELYLFAKKVQFPSHALIVRDLYDRIIEKGITDWDVLKEKFNTAKLNGLPVKIETDMRAHFNPTRMSVIKKCTQKLVKAATSTCPNCKRPGFIVTDTESGLPCELCLLPTRSTLKHILVCQGCGFKNEILFPNKKQYEEATYCDFCNP